MITIVNTPVIVSTVSYRCLVAHTMHVVQPDRPVAWPITISNHRSPAPEISRLETAMKHWTRNMVLGLASTHLVYFYISRYMKLSQTASQCLLVLNHCRVHAITVLRVGHFDNWKTFIVAFVYSFLRMRRNYVISTCC